MKIKYLTYIKSILFSLMFLTLPFSLAEQFIYQEASRLEDKITIGVIGMVMGLFETFLVLILMGYGIRKCQNVKNLNLGSYYKKHFRDLAIESLRGLGRIAVGLLLIVPGLKKIVQYYLIPYIVQFDPDYQDGKIDVLIEAERLLKGHFAKFAGLLLLTQIVIFVVQIASVNFNLFTTPVAWFLFYMLEIIFQASAFWVFYNYYVTLKKTVKEVN
jgi:hypothetical protein